MLRMLLVDNGTSYLGELQEFLSDFNVTMCSSASFDAKKMLGITDVVLLSGGHRSVLPHLDEYQKELDFIVHTALPVIGICLGFELIGHAFGASLHRLPEPKRGIYPIHIVKKDPIFSGILEPLTVYESHTFAIESLPSDMIEFARSDTGCEIIKHEERNIYGFQFHPEKSTVHSVGKRLFQNTLSSIFPSEIF